MEAREHPHREAWNKGKLVGQKAPLKPKDIWAIRIHLQNAHEVRDLAMFNLAIDSKLRGCDLVSLRVRDVTHGNQVLSRAMVVQRKTQWPVQFSISKPSTKRRLGRYSAYEVCLAPRLRADLPTRKRRSNSCFAPRPMQLPVAVNQPLVPVQPFQFHARRGQAVEAYAAVH